MCKFAITFGIGLLAALWLAGCSGGSSSGLFNAGNTPGIGAPGTVKLVIADAPSAALADVEEVNVTISRIDLLYDGRDDSTGIADPDDQDNDAEAAQVRAATRDGNDLDEDDDDVPITVFNGSQTINLLALANQPMANLLTLATEAVPSGHYKGIRLYLADGSNWVKKVGDDTHYPLTVPSNKLQVPIPFDIVVSPQETETILLDFDLSAPGSFSFSASQGYVLSPVLRASENDRTGNVSGILALPDGVTAPEELEAKISVALAGDEEADTDVELGTDEGGTTAPFAMHGLPAGTYTLTVTIEVGDQEKTFEISNVVVTVGGNTDLGTVVIPVELLAG